MKKITNYILGLFPVFGLFACEQDMEVYSAPENRLNIKNKEMSITRTFVYDEESRVLDTVWLELETMGFVVDYDRPFILEQVVADTNKQAEAGVHFIALDDPLVAGHYKIPAGKSKANVPIVLKRDPSLRLEEVTLGLKIGVNEHFVSGYEPYRSYVIKTSDILVQPTHWDMYASYYFAGKYGEVKHRFMINVTAEMGITVDEDFFFSLVGDPSKVDMAMTDFWFYFFSEKLAEENAARAARGEGPLREAPGPGQTEGDLVKFTRYEF